METITEGIIFIIGFVVLIMLLVVIFTKILNNNDNNIWKTPKI
jgi:hypothetical protein